MAQDAANKGQAMTKFKQLRIEMALDDWHDKWGTALNWHFRICDALQFRDADIPTEWGFQAGLGLPDDNDIFSDIPVSYTHLTLPTIYSV